jgi:hypothetical protein
MHLNICPLEWAPYEGDSDELISSPTSKIEFSATSSIWAVSITDNDGASHLLASGSVENRSKAKAAANRWWRKFVIEVLRFQGLVP